MKVYDLNFLQYFQTVCFYSFCNLFIVANCTTNITLLTEIFYFIEHSPHWNIFQINLLPPHFTFILGTLSTSVTWLILDICWIEVNDKISIHREKLNLWKKILFLHSAFLWFLTIESCKVWSFFLNYWPPDIEMFDNVDYCIPPAFRREYIYAHRSQPLRLPVSCV
jgi:hypothetical protein